MRSTLLLCAVSLLCGGRAVGQDQNWGVRVRCYVVQGEVVCPGCPQRAGLSCPRSDPDRNRVCGGQVTPPYINEEENTPECDEETTETKAPEGTTDAPKSSTPLSQIEVDLMKNETWKQEIQKDINMRAFLYRLLQPYAWRQKREVLQLQEPEEGTCQWNGDCPCPQICCRAGEGCPRRCKMGIRLPPPWGKR